MTEGRLNITVLTAEDSLKVFRMTQERIDAALERFPEFKDKVNISITRTSTSFENDPSWNAEDYVKFRKGVADADIMIGYMFPLEEVKAVAPRLKWIHIIGAGVEHLLPLDWLPEDAVLTNNRGAHAPKSREYVMMALLMLANHMPRLMRAQQKHLWDGHCVSVIKGSTAAILGAALSSFLLEKLGQRGAFAAAAALYAFGLLGDSYYGLAAGVPAMRAALDAVIAVTGYTRSGLFFAPLFMLLGHGLRTAKPPRRSVCAAALAATGALLIAEGLVLRSLGWQKHDSMYLMLPFVMYFLFALLASARGNCPRWAADFSLLIYVLHPAVIIAVRGAARILGLWGLLVDNSLGHYLAVCAVTGLISAALLLFARRFTAKCRPDSRAWVEVDADAYRRNARALMSLMPPGQRLMAVLKSNAYGLGAQQAVDGA